MKEKENPKADDATRGANGFKPDADYSIPEIFQELAALPRWVPYQMVWNPKREKWDKIPYNGSRKLSTKAPMEWLPFIDAANIAKEHTLPGVGFVLTGGVIIGGWRLIGLDFDEVDFENFKAPFVGYAEKSPSETGVRMFAWIPDNVAKDYRDVEEALYPDCGHVEIYIGSAARFLTVTFNTLSDAPIPYLKGEALLPIISRLKPAIAPSKPLSLMSEASGNVLDLDNFKLTPDQKEVIIGQGKHDRSAVIHGMIIKLLDEGANREDIFATLLHCHSTRDYFLSHRHNDEQRAMDFARSEIEKAYRKSKPGLRERLAAFNEGWMPGKTGNRPDLIGPIGKPAAPNNDPPFRRKPLSQLLKEIRPYTWLVEGVLPKGHFIALLGPPNSGKTAIALDLALRTALGVKLGPRRIQRARVVYIAAENPEEVKLRIQLWCDHHKVDPAELDDWFSLVEHSVFFDEEVRAGAFHAEWSATPPGLVVIDTFSANFAGESENSATEVMRWFNHGRQYLIQPFGCAVIVLHHPPKNSDNPFEWRGSGGATATLDSTWAAINNRGTITLMQGKHRSPTFDDLFWKYCALEVAGLVDNFGNPAMSILVTPTGKSVEVGRDHGLMKLCAGIDAGITTYRELAEVSGICKSDIGKALGEMRVANDGHGKLLAERKGVRYLTAEGKEWAADGRNLLGGKLTPPAEMRG